MKKTEFYQSLFDFYLLQSDQTVEQIAQKYGMPVTTCAEELQKIHIISEHYKKLPELEPSTITINKICTYAREEALRRSKKYFWFGFLRPVSVAASLALVGFLAFFVWSSQQAKQGQMFAQSGQVQPRLFATPFDAPSYDTQLNASQRSPYLYPLATQASVGSVPAYNFDEALNTQSFGSDLSAQEVEALYFRARKLEKLGYAKQALNDYLFIAEHYPRFDNKAVTLSLASCYQLLGEKKTALEVLNQYVKLYGKSDELVFWMDQLKSETF